MNAVEVVATLVAHDERRLAGEGREFHLAIDAFGDVPRQGGLAGSGIAEQAEDGGVPFRPGFVLSQSATACGNPDAA
jgi:hypothetical protein